MSSNSPPPNKRLHEPRALKPVPAGEGEELEGVLRILKEKGVGVVRAAGAGE